MTGRLLANKAFEAARQFIYSSARPLEIARFEYMARGHLPGPGEAPIQRYGK